MDTRILHSSRSLVGRPFRCLSGADALLLPLVAASVFAVTPGCSFDVDKEGREAAECRDGMDNDGNGKRDCEDPGCSEYCGGTDADTDVDTDVDVDTDTDVDSDTDTGTDCGGEQCRPGEICEGGSCTCAPGTVDCTDYCANLSSDDENCGRCGRACAAGETCRSGRCR